MQNCHQMSPKFGEYLRILLCYVLSFQSIAIMLIVERGQRIIVITIPPLKYHFGNNVILEKLNFE